MKGQYNNTVKTNKGIFQVRYASKTGNGTTVLVIGKNLESGNYAECFDGDFGDEILFTKEGLKKFDAELPKTFRI